MTHGIYKALASRYDREWQSWRRFLEALTMFLHLFISLPGRGFAVVLLLYLLIFQHWAWKLVCICYIGLTILDRHTPHRGGRRLDWLRRGRFFQFMANYFPINLQFTAELPPEDNYLVASHPHGVLFFSYTVAFGADIFQLEAKKKLKTFTTTLNSNFWLPLAREYLLAIGQVSASEESLTHLLSEPKGGNLVNLLPGGSSEAALSAPSQYRFLLKNRKGFCRIALQTGASLLPCISFGEVDCYDLYMPPSDSWFSRVQLFIKNWTGIYLLIYKAPGGWCYMWLPKRTPITTVLGTPIKVTKTTSPSREQIAQLHSEYIDSLQKLFESEKYKYLSDPANVKLIIE